MPAPASRARSAVTRCARSRSPTPRCSTARPARPAANRWPTAGCPGCSSSLQLVANAQGLICDLAREVGAEHVLTDADLLAGYTTDWTRRYQGDALCAVRPGSAAEVASVLRACRAH